MSKGTKQIRIGKVERFLKKVERQVVDIDELLMEKDISIDYINKKAEENKVLERVIRQMREEFELV